MPTGFYKRGFVIVEVLFVHIQLAALIWTEYLENLNSGVHVNTTHLSPLHSLVNITMGLSLLSTSFPRAFQTVFHRPLLFDATEPLDAELLADTERHIPIYNLRGDGVTINYTSHGKF